MRRRKDKNPPPLWIRCILVMTCTLVSVFHGSNDAQKGMGLIMLILIGIVPGAFALNLATDPKSVVERAPLTWRRLDRLHAAGQGPDSFRGRRDGIDQLSEAGRHAGLGSDVGLGGDVSRRAHSAEMANLAQNDFSKMTGGQRRRCALDIYLVGETHRQGEQGQQPRLGDGQGSRFPRSRRRRAIWSKITKYIPLWVKIMVACALGFGTMVGWKRIVVTVGEKIGKSHLTYAQGASAELMAATTIGLADGLGLPVSTTHVLSSGIAGTMAANRSGLQKETLISILLAWVLTLPVCIFLGATLFSAALYVTFHVFGIQ